MFPSTTRCLWWLRQSQWFAGPVFKDSHKNRISVLMFIELSVGVLWVSKLYCIIKKSLSCSWLRPLDGWTRSVGYVGMVRRIIKSQTLLRDGQSKVKRGRKLILPACIGPRDILGISCLSNLSSSSMLSPVVELSRERNPFNFPCGAS